MYMRFAVHYLLRKNWSIGGYHPIRFWNVFLIYLKDRCESEKTIPKTKFAERK